MPTPRSLPASAQRLDQSKRDLWSRAESGSIAGFPWEYAHIVDRYFEERVAEADPQPFDYALIAVGGYGRGRLCPGSDVDVLLLFGRRIPSAAENLAKHLFHPLWDLGLDLGHGARTIGDCLSLARKDYQVLASLMDARPLAGDAHVFTAFKKRFDEDLRKRTGGPFVESLRAHNLERAAKYGDASAMLEPELKNGLGGLRDGQQTVWLTRIAEAMGKAPVFLPEELAGLREDQAFVNRARTAVHLAARRKNDRLFFDLQPPAARLLGFVPAAASPLDTGRAVEFFLSRLHRSMTRMKSMRETLFQEAFAVKAHNEREPETPGVGLGPHGMHFTDASSADAGTVLAAFLESARSGTPMAWSARRLVRANAARFAAQLRDRRETLDALLDVFLAPQAGPALDALVETRLLPAIFPEFGDVERLIQFNDYHVHPVGPHTLKTVAHLAWFLTDDVEWTGEIAARIERPRRLVLAGFFHDLGKGEPDHAVAGAAIARDALARFGQDRPMVDEVAFLVESHLLLPTAATRRDLSDERTIADVAAQVRTTQRLDMLYLLSAADAMATGPRAWNSWTQALLAELYFKTRDMLERPVEDRPSPAQRMDDAKAAVRAACRDLDEAAVDAALDAMPDRAFSALDARTLAEHIRLAQRFRVEEAHDMARKPSPVGGKGVTLLEAEASSISDAHRLTVVARDRPGLFATLAGAVSLHGLDILAADLFTWSDGVSVDVFTVRRPDNQLDLEEVWARVRRSIGYALVGKLDIDARLEERRRSPLVPSRIGPRLSPIVAVDNAASDDCTVIETAAADRLGLLHDMAAVLARHDVSIHLAQIATIRGRVADVFHVRDAAGGKITDPARIEAIRDDLLDSAE